MPLTNATNLCVCRCLCVHTSIIQRTVAAILYVHQSRRQLHTYQLDDVNHSHDSTIGGILFKKNASRHTVGNFFNQNTSSFFLGILSLIYYGKEFLIKTDEWT